jgi:hypothetical protein
LEEGVADVIDRSPDRDPHADDPGSEESFVRRWSRRKAAGRPDDPDPKPDPETTEQALSSATTTTVSPRELTDADMPPIDELDEHADVSGFFSPGVSEELRRLALRKVFHLPSFNLRDGLDDYDDDFTRFAALGDTLTADIRHRIAVEAQRRGESGPTHPDPQPHAGESSADPDHGEHSRDRSDAVVDPETDKAETADVAGSRSGVRAPDPPAGASG